MTKVGAYLYIAENSNTTKIYIGIGESTTRIHGHHNSDAQRLIKAHDTVISQTPLQFSSVEDARMAEAIAIHIAVSAGKTVFLDADDELGQVGGEQATTISSTNRAATKSSRYLVPYVPRRDGVVTYSSLRNTAIVTMRPEALSDGTDRGTVHGGKTAQELAARALGNWNLKISRDLRYDVNRLIVRMKKSDIIIADWDLAKKPTMDTVFVPRKLEKFDPRKTRGMTLDMEGMRLSNGVTWSQDIPVPGRQKK
ncbi:hypothetical protein AB0N24_04205 [Arthrobacter sp. NPDC093128]|uniref:hypothetical protein n=1 Tax=Arthrobacter sp. NPDC093128 TaxID=3154979 RepID=UPI00341C5CB1